MVEQKLSSRPDSTVLGTRLNESRQEQARVPGLGAMAPEGASAAPGKLTSTVAPVRVSLAEGRVRSWVDVDDGDHKG
jgi:hypothetical protein